MTVSERITGLVPFKLRLWPLCIFAASALVEIHSLQRLGLITALLHANAATHSGSQPIPDQKFLTRSL